MLWTLAAGEGGEHGVRVAYSNHFREIPTIIFVLCENGTRLEKPEIVQRVNEIKPHFSREVTDAAVDEIWEVLDCVSCG